MLQVRVSGKLEMERLEITQVGGAHVVPTWVSSPAHCHAWRMCGSLTAGQSHGSPKLLCGFFLFSLPVLGHSLSQISLSGRSEVLCFSCLGWRVGGWYSPPWGAGPGILDAFQAQAKDGKCLFLGFLYLSKTTTVSAFHLTIPATSDICTWLCWVDASRRPER